MDEQIQNGPSLIYTGNPAWSKLALILGPCLLALEVLDYLGVVGTGLTSGSMIMLLVFAIPTIGFSGYGYRFVRTYRLVLSKSSLTVVRPSGQKTLALDQIGLLVLRTTANGYGSGAMPVYLIYDREGRVFEQMNVTLVKDFRNFMLHLKLYSASPDVYLVKDTNNTEALTKWRVNLPGKPWQQGEPPQRYHATMKSQLLQTLAILVVMAVLFYVGIHWLNSISRL